MAMDALKNISTNVPDWLQKLGDLGGQIERRQLELAAAPDGSGRSVRSLKNRGSNESLKQKDDGQEVTPFTFTSPYEPLTTPHFPEVQSTPKGPSNANGTETATRPSPSPPTSPTAGPNAVTSTEIKQQSKQAMMVAQARARAQVRKRHRSQSIVSIEGNPGAYRSRSMIIVYYDSFVQSFFEELVKFVSASRNLMRKAKMPAKVAHIKRLAEMDTPDDDEDDEDAEIKLPSMRYLQSRRAGAMPFARAGTRGLLNSGPSDFYDELDKALEYVQSMAERAAHQFLRDGDCNEEIRNISRKMGETKELAEKEMERIMHEEPELANQCESPKFRTHRPPAVRRELNSANKESTSPNRVLKETKRPAPSSPPALGAIEPELKADSPMEVDPNEGLGDMEPRTRRGGKLDMKASALVAERALPGAERTDAPKVEASVPVTPQT